jgi:hypothetical protein
MSDKIEGACLCGAVRWSFDGVPDSATACNCTACHRYGALWAYDYEDERVRVAGPTRIYARGVRNLAFHFCPDCSCVAYWRSLKADELGRRRIAVNLRLATEPLVVAGIVIDHFDGFDTFDDLPRDGRCVSHMWF